MRFNAGHEAPEDTKRARKIEDAFKKEANRRVFLSRARALQGRLDMLIERARMLHAELANTDPVIPFGTESLFGTAIASVEPTELRVGEPAVLVFRGRNLGRPADRIVQVFHGRKLIGYARPEKVPTPENPAGQALVLAHTENQIVVGIEALTTPGPLVLTIQASDLTAHWADERSAQRAGRAGADGDGGANGDPKPAIVSPIVMVRKEPSKPGDATFTIERDTKGLKSVTISSDEKLDVGFDRILDVLVALEKGERDAKATPRAGVDTVTVSAAATALKVGVSDLKGLLDTLDTELRALEAAADAAGGVIPGPLGTALAAATEARSAAGVAAAFVAIAETSGKGIGGESQAAMDAAVARARVDADRAIGVIDDLRRLAAVAARDAGLAAGAARGVRPGAKDGSVNPPTQAKPTDAEVQTLRGEARDVGKAVDAVVAALGPIERLADLLGSSLSPSP